VLADETSNKGHIEELALFLRLVKNNEIYEEFLSVFVRLLGTLDFRDARNCVKINVSRPWL